MKKNSMIAKTVMFAIVSVLCCMACDKDEPNPGGGTTPGGSGGSGGNGGSSGSGGTVAVTAVKLNKTTLELQINARETLTATIEPANASVKIVTWSSSNEKVAKVSGTGEVTGVAAGTATITAKAGSASGSCTVTVKAEEKPLPPLEVKITGTINHTTYTKGQSGTVEFNRFPATVDEFKAVREMIGGEPHGAVALELMAMEMYRRDRNIGLECIKLTNTSTNANVVVSRLKELFGGDVNYNRPYQTAAYLKGAEPGTGYNPTKPYTVEVIVDPATPYQESGIFQSTVLSLRIKSKGRSHGSDGLSVLKTKKPGEPGEKGKFFIISSNTGMLAQVAPISFEHEFKGLD